MCLQLNVSLQEEFEDTKGVIRIHRAKDRQHNGQKKKDKKTIYKTKDRVTRTPLKTGVKSGANAVSS